MSGLGIAALAILGPVGLFLLVAIVLRVRERRQHPLLARLTSCLDLSRTDIPGDEQAPGGGQ